MVACVIQAAPYKTPVQILEAIHKSAHLFPQHNMYYGYGIPDFEKVLSLLGVSSVDNYKTSSHLIYYPNPAKDKLYLYNDKKIIESVKLYDIAGKLLRNVDVGNYQTFIDLKGISKGFIFVKVVYYDGNCEVVKCVVMEN
jgi:hypothetical protein